jgi:hypothetical protein
MRIGAPEIREHADRVEYRTAVEWSAGSAALWYAVEREHAGLLTELSDAALVGLLIPAMAAGEDIHLEGPVSDRLCFSLSGPLQRLWRYAFPALHPVRIVPKDLRRGFARASGVAAGFSGGIDSFCLVADHTSADCPPSLALTHLLFNNVGSHGPDGQELFRQRYARLRPAADRMGLPFLWVDSNLSDFYRPPFGFLATHVARNASVPFLLQRGIGRYLYASGYSFAEANAQPTGYIGHSETMALPLLSTDALETMSVGAQYTRVEKTLRVAEVPASYEFLDVCAGGNTAGNCSACRKCMRTLLTLDIAGLLDRYALAFDLTEYRRRRDKFIGSTLRGHHAFDVDVVRFAVARGYRFPLKAYLSAPLRTAALVAEWATGARKSPRAQRGGA